MRAGLIFDDEGRAIGLEMRSNDQWRSLVSRAGAWIGEVPTSEAIQYRGNLHKWYVDDKGEIRRRQKVALQKPARQRMRHQPAMRWMRKEAPDATPWQPRTVYGKGDLIAEGYECFVSGITGDTKPAFDRPAHWEYMPPVEWVPGGEGQEERRALNIYEAGEAIVVNGQSWIVDRPGVTALSAPEFVGDRVVDRERLVLPIPDLGGHPVDLRIGRERHRVTGPVELVAKEPTRLTVQLDSPAYYSDPYVIAVESP